MKERIISAALGDSSGKIYSTGCNHAECYLNLGYTIKDLERWSDAKWESLKEDEGFKTNMGRFVDRYEAAEIAKIEDIDYLLAEDLILK